MDFATARALFGVGLILQLVGMFTMFFDSGIVAFVGLILMLAGVYGLAKYYGRFDIFRNMIYAVVLVIVGIVVAVLGAFGIALTFFGWGPPYGPIFWTLLTSLIALWIILWVFVVASAYFERRAFLGLFEESGVKNFESAAKFIWWGALTFVVLVGAILWIVALVLAAVGAFELKPREGESSGVAVLSSGVSPGR